MKTGFKKLIFCTATILIIILNSYTFSGLEEKNPKALLPLAATDQADQTEAEDEEENNNFNFIKSNEEAVDFLYDGSLLLYGGIVLIAISCAGIIITFIPRRRKKRKRRRK